MTRFFSPLYLIRYYVMMLKYSVISILLNLFAISIITHICCCNDQMLFFFIWSDIIDVIMLKTCSVISVLLNLLSNDQMFLFCIDQILVMLYFHEHILLSSYYWIYCQLIDLNAMTRFFFYLTIYQYYCNVMNIICYRSIYIVTKYKIGQYFYLSHETRKLWFLQVQQLFYQVVTFITYWVITSKSCLTVFIVSNIIRITLSSIYTSLRWRYVQQI